MCDKKTGRVVRGVVLKNKTAMISRRIFQAELDGRRIIENAEEKAKQIIADALEKKEEIEKQGRLEGIEAGKAEMVGVLSRVAAEAEKLRQNAADRMIELAVQIARKILEEELTTSPEKIRLLARKALKGAKWAQSVKIKANPKDLEMLENSRGEFMSLLSSVNELSIVGDSEVPIGGCVVETEEGEMDATLETQVSAMYQALKKELNNE